MSRLPLISIVTVSYNAAATIEDAIRSVLQQTYPHIEYIVIDGGSKDGTVDLLRRYDTQISHWVSEPDKGIYDAMNKGIALATGEYIGFLNADDFFANNDSVQKIVDHLLGKNTDAVFSQLDIVDPSDLDRVQRKYRVATYSRFMLKNGVMPPHPTFYCRKSCYTQLGVAPYKTDYRIAADFELLVRMLLVVQPSWRYLPVTTVKMRAGGVSSENYQSRVQLNREIIRGCLENGLYTNPLWLLLKVPLRICELIR